MSWKIACVVAAVATCSAILARLGEDAETGTASWDAARASGFAGYLLLWGSVVTGVGLHLRLRPRSAGLTWVLESHRIFSTLGLSFVAAHVVSLLLDPVVRFSIVDGLLPFTSAYRPLQVGAGTIAMWLLATVLASTALTSMVSLPTWRRLHYLSFPCFVLALVHGLTSGSDSGEVAAVAIYAATAAVVGAMLVVRVVGRGWVGAAELQATGEIR